MLNGYSVENLNIRNLNLKLGVIDYEMSLL